MTHSWFFPRSFIAQESTTSILLRYSHIAIDVKAIEKKTRNVKQSCNNRFCRWDSRKCNRCKYRWIFWLNHFTLTEDIVISAVCSCTKNRLSTCRWSDVYITSISTSCEWTTTTLHGLWSKTRELGMFRRKLWIRKCWRKTEWNYVCFLSDWLFSLSTKTHGSTLWKCQS